MTHETRIASELSIRPQQAAAVLELSGGGATVPFIARYRKEATGNLDEVQIQKIIDRNLELTELEARRRTILSSIEEQGKLTSELAEAIAKAQSRTELEDLYLPYRPKRRTRATIAKERGLEPLADLLWSDTLAAPSYPRDASRESLVLPFVDVSRGVATAEEAVAGAKDICAERVAEDAALRKLCRVIAASRGQLRSAVLSAKKEVRGKFDQYYEHAEPLAKAPSHRILAIFRGEAEEFLSVTIDFPDADIVATLQRRVLPNPDDPRRIFLHDLRAAIADSWRRLISPSLELELRRELKERADKAAIDVFGTNLRNLLLAPPASGKRVLAIDPGLRTGSKAAMLDETGRLLATETIYTERGASERQAAERRLRQIIESHSPDLIAVGNGTGNREAEAFARQQVAALQLAIPIVSVSEQGASVYSASEVAREEFPELDVSLRGAVSIGRRLQDPLAELVRIDPKSIGVGQYQHDVDQILLRKKLDEVVDSCVNLVGVDVNTASPQLLAHVSGIGPVLAQRIVQHRNDNGPFASRRSLLDVRGLGPRAFEQCAGFLRIREGHPLDNSAVHPERYDLVARIASDLAVTVGALVGNAELARRIEIERYYSADVGEPTMRDIVAELQKPGRDPRGSFDPPAFREELTSISDLKEGMVLDGVVTNVAAFGAFVDVGVHQDGLVHVSHLANRFVRDPGEIVRVGDRVTVKVLTVDVQRKRIGLSMKG